MDFEWDPAKAATNRGKHALHLADAPPVFEDPYALTRPDSHATEERFVTLGRNALDRVIVVVWSWNGDAIRLISVRPATPRERRNYAEDAMRAEYDFSKARRGPVLPVVTGKTRITIRIDDDILDWYRAHVDAAGGGNYQTLINQALRRTMTERAEPLEAVVRRVIRAELSARPKAPAKRRKVSAA